MTLRSVRIGSLVNFHTYDDALFSTGIEADAVAYPTLYGSTAAGGSLTLHSTTDPTKGDISLAGILVVDEAGSGIGFYGAPPVTKPSALTSGLTHLTSTAPGVEDFAISDLVDSATGNYGFATKDEGNTVLEVITNLQVRLDELESKLQSLGLLT